MRVENRTISMPNVGFNILVIIIMILPALLFLFSPSEDSKAHSSAGYSSTVIFREDFEGELPGQWLIGDPRPIGDDAGDFAPDPDCGRDYWGISEKRYHNGSHSAWCAQIGFNSGYGNVSNAAIGKIDNNMSTYMETRFHFQDFDNVTLSFWYWAESTYSIYPYNLVDYLEIRAFNGTGIGGSGWEILWHQPMNRTNGWTHVTIDMPINKILVGFYYNRLIKPFVPVTVEGAYVDDIEFIGYKNAPPADKVNINIKNINDPKQHYSANGFSDGGLELNITWNGSFRKLVFIMPQESVNFTVSAGDLPATIVLFCSNFGNPREFTYELYPSDVGWNNTANVTINSNAMQINHTVQSSEPQNIEFTLPLLTAESIIIVIGLLFSRMSTKSHSKNSSRNSYPILLVGSALVILPLASLFIQTEAGFLLWFSAPIVAWLSVLSAGHASDGGAQKTLPLAIVIMITIVWLSFTWYILLSQASIIAAIVSGAG